MMISNHKRLCLALAMTLFGASLSAAQTSPVDQEQLRQELREAQKQLSEVGRRVAELSAQMGDDPARVQMFRYLGNPDRAVIGVLLGEEGQHGVSVEGVTPGGPAEKAGLRSGDTITAVRGKQIAGERANEALRDALRDLKDGDKVTINYLRGGKAYAAEMAATRQGSAFALFGGPNMQGFAFESPQGESLHFPPNMDPEVEAMVERATRDAGGLRVNMMAMSAMGGLRLTALNAGLGRYFGVNNGALVLEVDGDRYTGLQPGDVILEVDGNPIEDPRDAMRELSRQNPEKKVELKLQRDRIPQLVKISVPEKSRAFFAPPAPPAPPTPPPAMSAPRPPAPPHAPHPAAAPTPPPPPRPESAMI